MLEFLSNTFLPTLFDMSLTGGIVILCVLAARLALKRAPKIFSYALWAVVLFRLLCPVSLSAGFSLLGALNAPARQASPVVSTVTYVRPAQPAELQPQTELPASQPDGPVSQPAATSAPVVPEQAKETVDWGAVAAWVWLVGAAAMAGYSMIALFRLRRKLVGVFHLVDNIYLADYISTPFVLGLVRPRIYLPSTLTRRELGCIIRHERYHIRHGDHVVKILAFIALCLHWFNPLVWVAFVLAGRDMEMRCDEAVVKAMGEEVKADYSAALLALSTGRLTIAGTPLAFGEGDPKGRIRNLLGRKQPRLWLSVAAGLACGVVIAACAANPAGQSTGGSGRYESMEDFTRQTMAAVKEVTYTPLDNGVPAQEGRTAQVSGTKLARLDKMGELEGLASEGVLEAWIFQYLVQIDVPPEQVALAGGMYEEDGWFDLEGQGGRNIVALRYPDGSYDILYDGPVNDNMSFYGWHNSYEEAIYDWYVEEKSLDLPLYVKAWGEQITYPEGTEPGSYPVHRYDGDGWYLYLPVEGWTQWTAGDTNWFWTSDYCSGFTLTVEHITTNLADYLAGETQGMTPADDSGRVFTAQGNGWCYRDSYVDAVDGGCWKISTKWFDPDLAHSTSAVSPAPGPMAPIHRQALMLMAESFTPDNRITPAAQAPAQENDEPMEAAKQALRQHMEQGQGRLEVSTGQEVRTLAFGEAEREWLQAMGEHMPWQESFPEGFYTLPGSLSLVMDEGSFLCFTPGGNAGQIMIDYVRDGITSSWWTADFQTYLWLTAVLQEQTIEVHDLDGDGFQEILAWPDGEIKTLIIYDFYQDKIQITNVAQELGTGFADYTGLIGNIQREYSSMVCSGTGQISATNVYRYQDGMLTYVCALENALLTT